MFWLFVLCGYFVLVLVVVVVLLVVFDLVWICLGCVRCFWGLTSFGSFV